jgi:pimeloyl-ACP methyl ester carboxylesterase
VRTPLIGARRGKVQEDGIDEMSIDISKVNIKIEEVQPTVCIEEETQHVVNTPSGNLATYVIRNDPQLPTIITYHDIGFNHTSSFSEALNYPSTAKLLKHFRIIHIDAPGQSPDELAQVHFPTIEQLATQITSITQFYKVRSFIGLGAGAGGDVLLRYALSHKDVEGLILLGTSLHRGGWGDWASSISSAIFGVNIRKSLASRYFTWQATYDHPELVAKFNAQLDKMNITNVTSFLRSYESRSDISASVKNLQFKVLLFVGRNATNWEGIVLNTQAYFNHLHMSTVEIDQCGNLIQWEQPEVLTQPIDLFLKGLGYIYFD